MTEIMFREQIRQLASARTPDDTQLYVVRRDLSGGINSRQHGSLIGENQVTVLYNADIGTAGQSSKRPGSVLIGNDVSNNTFMDLHNYERQGYSDSLIAYDDTVLWEWLGSGNWSAVGVGTFTTGQTDVGIVSVKESAKVPDDVFIAQNGVDNAQRFHKDSSDVWAVEDLLNTNTSPPLTTVMCWYGNRLWCLKNDILNYSSAYPATYSNAFDRTTNAFRVPVGAERGLSPTRDTGILVLGENAIWGLAPTATPAVTDKPQPLVTDHGVVSKKGWVNVGDDLFYFAQDGFRALKRTIQDKLQTGQTVPLSYYLKDEFARISWGYIERLMMEYFDNKIFISVPTGANTFDVWVYYPAGQSFMIITGWSPRCWAKYKVSGQEYLYYGKHGDGVAYRAWYGYTDEGTTTTNGTAINYQEEGRKEDLGQPLVRKAGGTLKIKAISSGNYTLTVYASIDDQPYNTLGTMALIGNAPTLPIALPFTLASGNIITEEFPLDSLGEFNQIRVKIQHNAVNGSDDITILEREIISYQIGYQDE
jgi:hypothetical protein